MTADGRASWRDEPAPTAGPDARGHDSIPANDAYHHALARLYERTGGAWRLGLDRVRALLDATGNPHTAYGTFHIAGTNGKGSTVATLDAMLRGAGVRCGRYTSPHLVDFRERIVVDGQAIEPERIVEWLDRWDDTIVRLGATFFEATTVMAFDYFRTQGAEVAVIETGLGGRLDATNVVDPLATGVTQIGLDHVEYLGHDVFAIAMEKAGIFKAGRPAVIGESDPAVRRHLREEADRRGASPIVTRDDEFSVTDIVVHSAGTSFTLALRATGEQMRLETPLIGEYQAYNTAVALLMLDAAGGGWKDVARAAPSLLGGVRLGGRFQTRERWLFDVAHNPDGARMLAGNLGHIRPGERVTAVVSVLRDKDWRGILLSLAGIAERFILTNAPTAPASRAWHLDEVTAWAHEQGLTVVAIPDFDDALTEAASADRVLVTGSFHTVGDAMQRLQVDPLAP